jgi:glycine betaine/proline transport system substrate-binding protein
MRRKLQGLIALVGALALAGCGSTASITAAPGVKTKSECGTVNIAVNPWIGYEADVAVVSYLLRNELNCKVNEKNLTETASWDGFANNSVDVILETWGHDDLKKKHIDDKKDAVELGLDGNKGAIGWYVPPWMAKTYPDITDYKNLNKYASLLQTGQSGGKGQLLEGDPSFVTNDAALIKNLNLDYSVVYAGSEDKLIAAFRDAEKNQTPLLGYFYEPQWLLSEIKLVPIKLPVYTPGCDSDPKTVACGYQPYDLDKIGRKAFVDSGSPAAKLVENFSWSNDDQNQVARDITENKLTNDQAAKKWLDAHQSTWKKWMPVTD